MSAVLKQSKPKRCKQREPGCQVTYIPRNSLQPTCFNPKCAIAFSKSKEMAGHVRKLRRAEKREGRERIKTIGERLQEAQRPFNAWIRWRDRDESCISCGRTTSPTWHAGHYKPAGANAALRFDPTNVHKQCEHCNTFLSANLVEYRPRLVAKIGLEAVERLEGPQPDVKWTHDELKVIRREYQTRLREAQKAA